MLSFKQCERNTFSMRAEREVRYSIRVQHVDAEQTVQHYCTGITSHRFGLGSKTCKSKVARRASVCTLSLAVAHCK